MRIYEKGTAVYLSGRIERILLRVTYPGKTEQRKRKAVCSVFLFHEVALARNG